MLKPKKRAWQKPKKPCTGECDFCKKSINSISGWYCWQCRRWFCELYRFPQDHNCIGLPKPPIREVVEVHVKGKIYSRG